MRNHCCQCTIRSVHNFFHGFSRLVSSSSTNPKIKDSVKSIPQFINSKTSITLFPGDGIGPEIIPVCVDVVKSMGIPIEWESFQVNSTGKYFGEDAIGQDALESILRNRVGLKGPMVTKQSRGSRSINRSLRINLNLYATVRWCRSIPSENDKRSQYRFPGTDLVVIRDNTEGLYSVFEHEVQPGLVESLRLTTKVASERIALFAFEFALNHGRSKVTAVHKAGIMKMGDGLFLDCCRELAPVYSKLGISYDEMSVDTCCLRLVTYPQSFDVMVMPNIYGDIVSDLCSAVAGGLSICSSAQFGDDAAVFEVVHGSRPPIRTHNYGHGDPTAMLLSAAKMLRYCSYVTEAMALEAAVDAVLSEDLVRMVNTGGGDSTARYSSVISEQVLRIVSSLKPTSELQIIK